jgi:hypothetical protein
MFDIGWDDAAWLLKEKKRFRVTRSVDGKVLWIGSFVCRERTHIDVAILKEEVGDILTINVGMN